MGSPVGADSKKPFSPPGTSTLDDSAALIQDFAAALHHLVRLLRGAMADHPVIVAARQRPELPRGAPTERRRHFKFDLVEEGVTWFEPQGSSIARHAIEVTSPA